MSDESSSSQSSDPGFLMNTLSNQQFRSIQGGGKPGILIVLLNAFLSHKDKRNKRIKLEELCYPGKISILTKVRRSQTSECDCRRWVMSAPIQDAGTRTRLPVQNCT